MAILKIARMGHPVLRRRADPVPDPTAPEIRLLVADMLETMGDAGGTRLAAPQVHVPLRLVVFFVARRRAAFPDGARAADRALNVLLPHDHEPPDRASPLGPGDRP